MEQIKKEDEMIENPQLLQYHCVIHQQNLPVYKM
jgi:hypothetical protein